MTLLKNPHALPGFPGFTDTSQPQAAKGRESDLETWSGATSAHTPDLSGWAPDVPAGSRLQRRAAKHA